MASSSNRRDQVRAAPPPLLLGALVGLAAWLVGAHAWSALRLVNWDGLQSAAAAYTVMHGAARPSLSLLGYAKPPLPGVLLTPVAWLWPGLVRGGLAQVLLGAVATGLGVWWAARWFQRAGVGWVLAWVLTLILFLHPMVFSLAAGGSPTALFLPLAFVGMASLASWAAERRLLDLMRASLALGLAALTDHLGILLVVAAAVAVGLWAARRAEPAGEGRPAKAGGRPSRAASVEGQVVFFLLLPAYLLGLWFLASGVIMGDAWMSLRHWYTGLAAMGGAVVILRYVTVICGAWVAILLLAVYLRGRRARAAGIGIVGAALAAAAVAVALGAIARLSGGAHVTAQGGWGEAAPVAVLVKAAVLVAVGLVFAEASGRWGEWWRQARGARIAAVLLAVLGVGYMLQQGLRGDWAATPGGVVRGHIAAAVHAGQAEEAAVLARGLVDRRPRTLVYVHLDRPRSAFAVGLFAGAPLRVRDLGARGKPQAGSLAIVAVKRGGQAWPLIRRLLPAAWGLAPVVLRRTEGLVALELGARKPAKAGTPKPARGSSSHQ